MPHNQRPEPISDEIRFLITCCQTEPSQDDIELIEKTIRQSSSILNPPASILQLASRHGVLPLVYKTLKTFQDKKSLSTIDHRPSTEILAEQKQQHYSSSQLPITNYQLPENLLVDLKSAYSQIARRNMLMTAELIHIMKLLRENNIEALALKGPALAQQAYDDITLRQYGDLDILVHRKDFRKIASLMMERDYTPLFPVDTFKGNKVMFDMNNDCPFYDRKRGLAVEIHWDFFRKLALPTKQFSPWEHTVDVIINGTAITTLHPETHLLYHSLHGSKHIWERMNWIVDIDRFIRNVPGLDWEYIVTKAKALGALRMFLFGPALAQRFFNTPLPQQINALCQEAGFDDLIAFVISEYNRPDPTPEESLVKLKKVISLRDNFYYKSKTFLEFLFRPGINERRTVILPDALFWLYWLMRPFGMGYRFLKCRLFRHCKTVKK